MASIMRQVTSILDELGFAFQETSFEMIVSSGEIAILGKMKTLPDSVSLKILKNFPHLFVFHRTAPPKKGSFFIKISEAAEIAGNECDCVYEKYFPKAILMVRPTSSGGLVAHWLHQDNKPKEIRLFLKGILQ